MALSQDEVKIRLGMDSTALRGELARTSAFTVKNLKAMSGQIIGMLRSNLIVASIDLLRQIIPSAQEFWDKIYGLDEATSRKADESRKRIKDHRDALIADAARLEDALRKQKLDNTTPARRVEMLTAEVDAQKAAIEAAKKKVADAKADVAYTQGTKNYNARNELILEQARLEKNLIQERLKLIDLENAHKAARDAMWAADPPKLRGPNYPAPMLMNSMLPIARLPFMEGLKGAIDKTNIGLALYDALQKAKVHVIIDDVKP